MNRLKDIPQHVELTAVDYDPFIPPPASTIRATSSQIAMWRSTQLDVRATCAHRESLLVGLRGNVAVQSLIDALQCLPLMHRALRGHFSSDGSLFIIEPTIAVPIERQNLAALDADPRSAALNGVVARDAATPFDLRNGPLFRATIVQLGDESWAVLLSAHRAACDGWSMDVLLADLGRLYSATVGASALPSLDVHTIVDYVKYCESSEHARRVASGRDYWHKALAGYKSPTGLGDSGTQRVVTEVNHCLRQISRETTGAIKSFSRKEGVSAFGTLLAAYSALLGQLHTLPEVVINVPIAGQPDAEMEDCVGPLANVVPVRCKTDSGRAFSDLVHEIHGLILDGREHSQVGISDILQPEMSLATTASFTHVQKYPPGKVAFGSCDMDYQLAARTFDEPDIGVCVLESQHALTFHMHANARDYDQPSIAELLRLLESFLREACETPATSVATLMERARKSVAAAGPQPFNQASHSNEMSLAGFFGIGVRAVVSTAARNTNGSEDYVCEKPIVVTLQPGDPRKPPLLCIFGIQLYADLAVSIVDGTPVVGIHVPIISRPWRGRRPSLEEITDIYLGVVNEVCPSGPCNLAGLCFGGIVAYELARKLREQGRAVPAVFLFDAYLPNGRHVDYKLRASNIASSVLRRPVQTLGGALLKASARRAPLLLKSPVGQKTLERWVAKITGEDPTVPIDFPVLGEEAKSEVARLDAEKTFLDSTLVVFRASQADTPVWQNNDQDMGWGGRARSVICFDVASDHLGIVRRPHAERVSSEIMRQISAT